MKKYSQPKLSIDPIDSVDIIMTSNIYYYDDQEADTSLPALAPSEEETEDWNNW